MLLLSLGLGLEDGHVPTFWPLVYLDLTKPCNIFVGPFSAQRPGIGEMAERVAYLKILRLDL